MNRMIGGTFGVAVIGAVLPGPRLRRATEDPRRLRARVQLRDVGGDRGRPRGVVVAVTMLRGKATRGTERRRGRGAGDGHAASSPSGRAPPEPSRERAEPSDGQPREVVERRATAASPPRPRPSARDRLAVRALDGRRAFAGQGVSTTSAGSSPAARTDSIVSRVWLIVPRPGPAAITTGSASSSARSRTR